jgi:hypothetical protein
MIASRIDKTEHEDSSLDGDNTTQRDDGKSREKGNETQKKLHNSTIT